MLQILQLTAAARAPTVARAMMPATARIIKYHQGRLMSVSQLSAAAKAPTAAGAMMPAVASYMKTACAAAPDKVASIAGHSMSTIAFTAASGASASTTVPRRIRLFVIGWDINKSITLEDSTKKVTAAEEQNSKNEDANAIAILNSISAEVEEGIWDSKIPRKSFKLYVYNDLFPIKPDDKNIDEIKKKRQGMVTQFIPWLKQHNHPDKEAIIKRYNDLKSKYTDPETGHVKFRVFDSFYELLKKMRKLNYKFVIALRTFGPDLGKIANEIGSHPDGIKFTRWGEFKGKVLHLKGKGVLDTPRKIFDEVRQSSEHFAIQDEVGPWKKSGELSIDGKPVYFDSEGNSDELHVILDDNITGQENDIVNPIDVSGKKAPSESLLGRILLPVNPYEAAVMNRYFINLMAQSLLRSGYEQQAKEFAS